MRPIASVPGEIIPGAEFYDYTAKYVDDTSRLLISRRRWTRATTEARTRDGAARLCRRRRQRPRPRRLPDRRRERRHLS